MADNSFTSSAPECPFYKEEEKRVIRCEGLADGVEATHLVFSKKERREIHQNTYCKDHRNWEKCPLAKTIVSEKY